MRIRKHFVKIGVLVVVCVAVFGGQAVKSHYKTVRTGIQEGVRQSTPWEYEAKRLETLIRDKTAKIMEFEGKIAEVEANAQSHQADVDRLEAGLERDRKDLAAERAYLASEDPTFVIHGVSYTRQQVVASAEARMAQMKRDVSTLEVKREVIQALEQEMTQGYADLKEAYAHRDEVLRELEGLSAKMVNIQLRKQIQDLTQSLKDRVSFSSEGELAQSMQQFRHRVQMEERKLDAASQTQSAPALITHEKPSQTGLLEAMDRVLGEPTESSNPQSDLIREPVTNEH